MMINDIVNQLDSISKFIHMYLGKSEHYIDWSSLISYFGAGQWLTVLLCRVIQRIYTVNDNRPDDSKPHANEIILSFWGLYLGRDIKSIRSLFFCDVKEKTLKDAKKHVYAQMGNIDSRQPLVIRTGQEVIKETQFNRISGGTKFGRLAQRIVQTIEHMNPTGLQVVEFMFLPFSDQHDGDEDSEGSEVSGDGEDGEAGQAGEVDGRYVGDHKVNYNFQIFLG